MDLPTTVGAKSLSIGDGGVTFSVQDKNGYPAIVIHSSHFGNNTHEHVILTDVKSLKELAELFDTASKYKFTDEYCYAARVRDERPKGAMYCDDGGSFSPSTGNVDLSIWYCHQFVQNEKTDVCLGGRISEFILDHTPILAGSVVGTVYLGKTAIQTFIVSVDGLFTFTDIGSPQEKCITHGSTIDHVTGKITLGWNADVGENHAIISYEYNMEASN